MKKLAIRLLLRILNGYFLNPTPCRYEFVGNVDAFSRSDIESTLKQSPTMTLREYLDLADRFKFCPISRTGLTVIEPDGSYTKNIEWRP